MVFRWSVCCILVIKVMENIEILAQSIIHIDEVKTEPVDEIEEYSLDFIEGGAQCPVKREVKEEDDEEEQKPNIVGREVKKEEDEEEELELPASVMVEDLKEEVEEYHEDPLGMSNADFSVASEEDKECKLFQGAVKDEATQQRIGRTEKIQAPPWHLQLELQEGQHSDEKPALAEGGHRASTSTSGLSNNERQRSCTSGRPYCCDVCGKAFPKKYNLAKHKETHSGERTYMCDVCGEALRGEINFHTHMWMHKKERPHDCVVCGEAFACKSTLVKHMKAHAGERLYSCRVCGKAFTGKARLTVHMRGHTGERPYSCDLCPKAFADRSHLARHRRAHAADQPRD